MKGTIQACLAKEPEHRPKSAAEAGGVELRFGDYDLRSSDAKVLIDGRSAELQPASDPFAEFGGRTDHPAFRLDGLEVGSRMVGIAHPDYEQWRQAVTVRDQETTAVNVGLKPKPGRLTVRAEPGEIVLTVNGRTVRPEEIRNGEILLPAWKLLELQASARGHKTAQRSLTLEPNGAQTWEAALEKLRGAEEGQAWAVPDLNLEMAYIRPGTFTMGSENGDSDEKPLTRVTHQGLLAGEDRGYSRAVGDADGEQSLEL
jgi:hypothetical protein